MGQQKPNILFLISDTHGAWATGCYGSQVARTPSIDRLAAEGIVFDRAYAQNPLCVPSRQSLLTGQYSFQCGVLQNDTPMPRLYTVAHHLRNAGYETAALGKMHFIPDTESSRGKERHHGFAERIDYEEFWWYLRNDRGFPPVAGLPDDPWRLVHLEVAQHRLQGALVEPPDRGPDGPWGTLPHEDHQEAMVLRAWQEFLARERDRPFFACVSFQSPHPPFIPPAQFVEPFQGAMPLPDREPAHVSRHPIWRKAVRRPSDAIRAQYLRYYHAFVHYTDWCVGEALRLLEEAGVRDDTLVVYLSDHGEMGYHHGLVGKMVLYEHSVRVPLVMRLPGRTRPGRRQGGLVELLDLFPTVCDAAAIAPSSLPGRSLWPDLIADRDEGKEAAFAESYPMARNVEVFGTRPHRMIRTERWKLIQSGEVCTELFDTETDPEEKRDLSDEPAYRQVREELLARLVERLGPLPGEDVWRRRELTS